VKMKHFPTTDQSTPERPHSHSQGSILSSGMFHSPAKSAYGEMRGRIDTVYHQYLPIVSALDQVVTLPKSAHGLRVVLEKITGGAILIVSVSQCLPNPPASKSLASRLQGAHIAEEKDISVVPPIGSRRPSQSRVQ
jgi:hypothetical protein